jgi:amidophosphoribosyltransferase
VYFARPDSNVFERSVYQSRRRMGEMLATENGVEADLVIPVPDSGVPAAIGYSHQSGIPFEMGIIRNHYIGRTFIQPLQAIRDVSVKIKLNPQSHLLKGKRVIVIDDSLVRGTTSQKIIRLVRQAGAKEVHLRISAPPTIGPCYYGVDTPQKEQLIACQKTTAEICQMVNADSLAYLSVEGLMQAVKSSKRYCAACFTQQYPTEVPRSGGQRTW